ncbi:zinc finger CCCH domain-containing protein 14-like isoform X2 [Euphorbia lathyris]|uniref:zinc finger CCCH domain-containing protein 14-like isoform X2 n=1 Tax=Euphorbia lathyris TaxID=212925 RepID=UPI00331445A8
MERSASPTMDPKSASTPSSISPSLDLSPPADHHTEQFASSFTSLYHSIFPPKSSSSPDSFSFSFTPSTSSPSSAALTDDFDTEHRLNQVRLDTDHRLNQARLVLEFQELTDYYELSLARLQSLTKEIELLRQENVDLRLANSKLLKLLNIYSHAAIPRRFNSHEIVEPNRIEKRNPEKVTVPKSISVRSSGYLKVNRASASNGGQCTSSTRTRVTNHLDQLASESVQPRVCVAGGSTRENAAVEFNVYNQGMWKTELCNKWQETGACPYGENCQFAHGIKELHPVIRHPRCRAKINFTKAARDLTTRFQKVDGDNYPRKWKQILQLHWILMLAIL